MKRLFLAGTVLALAACAPRVNSDPVPVDLSQLWIEPVDLERRDLFHGPGGPRYVPAPGTRYDFLSVKQSGVNPGYDVTDPAGQEWSVKLGVEARTEVVVSRIHWAVGYHQPILHHVPRWTLVHNGADSVRGPARFRLEPPTQKKVGEWSWRRNPFIGTRELAGLYVMQVLFNNWDLKTAQNALYEVTEDGDGPSRWYMVRDLGATLGRSEWLTFGTKDDLRGFQREPFIRRIEGNRVYFAFEGGWMEPHLHSSVRPSDVRWISGLLARLSDQQWRDAFRAGGYGDAEAAPFIERLKEKVAEGLRAGAM